MTPEETAAKNQREFEFILKSPKRFAENARVIYLEGHIVLAVCVGETWEVYALTPHHAKRLAQLFAHQVKNYEAQQGEIPTNLDLSVPSPLQESDLKNPPKGDGEPPEATPGKPDKPKKK